ncbi:MAG: hypothetical protein GX029_05890 [Pseudomonadaceae bacterium]|nr:hypothetical protein [Pseudomonadaceae bacterium]
MVNKNNALNLIVCIKDNKLQALLQQGYSKAQVVPIYGDIEYKISNAKSITAALDDLDKRIKSNNQQLSFLYWLVDKPSSPVWQLASNTNDYQQFITNTAWQYLSWEWLSTRFNSKNGITDKSLIEQVIPWLVSMDDAAEQERMQKALEQEHESESERLAAERATLRVQNEQLKAENAALRQVDKELLVTFLPALFARVFTILGAADLALLCGSVQPLNIPSPFPEPSTEALRVLQKKFRSLPKAAQLDVVQLVQHLPHRQRLNIRPEMRELVSELEEVNE